jgi:hypothetical protein
MRVQVWLIVVGEVLREPMGRCNARFRCCIAQMPQPLVIVAPKQT